MPERRRLLLWTLAFCWSTFLAFSDGLGKAYDIYELDLASVPAEA